MNGHRSTLAAVLTAPILALATTTAMPLRSDAATPCGATTNDLLGTFVAHRTPASGAPNSGYQEVATVTFSAPDKVTTDYKVDNSERPTLGLREGKRDLRRRSAPRLDGAGDLPLQRWQPPGHDRPLPDPVQGVAGDLRRRDPGDELHRDGHRLQWRHHDERHRDLHAPALRADAHPPGKSAPSLATVDADDPASAGIDGDPPRMGVVVAAEVRAGRVLDELDLPHLPSWHVPGGDRPWRPAHRQLRPLHLQQAHAARRAVPAGPSRLVPLLQPLPP